MAEETEKKTARAANSKDRKMNPGQHQTAAKARAPQPEWTKGLKRLYNSVVEEPLPDSFADLIAKLESGDS
jgi:hypothetical protein